MKQSQNKFDATGQSLGRLATQVSLALQGKDRPDYQPHIVIKNPVIVYNLALARFTGKKLSQKQYHKYSGYPSGIKSKKMNELFQKDPCLLFRILINNMLPKNKLRAKRLKILKLYTKEVK
ncbi:MAG: 50S ribosomal protein L13 [Patescibacteria group bacterium]